MYDDLVQLIDATNYVKFSGVQGRGVADEWIDAAERKLGLTLPPSYKWWLKKYGGGEINREEIFSIYQMDFEDAAPGDIVFVELLKRRQGVFGADKLFICDPGNDEAWYFDTTQKDEAGEYPVYYYDYTDRSSSLYARNFAEFLKRKIKYR
jgi:hypothetical protein